MKRVIYGLNIRVNNGVNGNKNLLISNWLPSAYIGYKPIHSNSFLRIGGDGENANQGEYDKKFFHESL
jgi:hypothetical protein